MALQTMQIIKTTAESGIRAEREGDSLHLIMGLHLGSVGSAARLPGPAAATSWPLQRSAASSSG